MNDSSILWGFRRQNQSKENSFAVLKKCVEITTAGNYHL